MNSKIITILIIINSKKKTLIKLIVILQFKKLIEKQIAIIIIAIQVNLKTLIKIFLKKVINNHKII